VAAAGSLRDAGRLDKRPALIESAARMLLNQTLTLALPGYASLYVVGLLLCLGLLVPFRQGRRPRPWARYPFWLFVMLLAVTLLPSVSGRPGLAMTGEAVACAGWDGAVAWADVEAVTVTQEGARIELTLTPAPLRPVALARLDEGSWRWPYWLDGRDGLSVAPGAMLACPTEGLALPAGLDGAALGRTMTMLAELNRAAPPGASPAGLAWCETAGQLTERCLADAAAAEAACRAEADYAACRAERLRQP
jgi:hypothetical protein